MLDTNRNPFDSATYRHSPHVAGLWLRRGQRLGEAVLRIWAALAALLERRSEEQRRLPPDAA